MHGHHSIGMPRPSDPSDTNTSCFSTLNALVCHLIRHPTPRSTWFLCSQESAPHLVRSVIIRSNPCPPSVDFHRCPIWIVCNLESLLPSGLLWKVDSKNHRPMTLMRNCWNRRDRRCRFHNPTFVSCNPTRELLFARQPSIHPNPFRRLPAVRHHFPKSYHQDDSMKTSERNGWSSDCKNFSNTNRQSAVQCSAMQCNGLTKKTYHLL